MTKKTKSTGNDTAAKTRKLQVRREILRDLTPHDLGAVAGGLIQNDPPGPCPRSRQSC